MNVELRKSSPLCGDSTTQNYSNVVGIHRSSMADQKFKSARKKYNIVLWDGEVLIRLGIIKNAGDTKTNRSAKKMLTLTLREALCIEDGK